MPSIKVEIKEPVATALRKAAKANFRSAAKHATLILATTLTRKSHAPDLK